MNYTYYIFVFFALLFLFELFQNKDRDYKNFILNIAMFFIGLLFVFYPRLLFENHFLTEDDSFLISSFIITFFVLDFITFLWHLLNHRIAFLWQFHSVHHSDLDLNTSSAFRFHFVEVFLGTSLRLGVFFLLALPIRYFLIYELIFQFFNIFQHAKIRLHKPIDTMLAAFFITPYVHHYHHYKNLKEGDSYNYGTILNLWDRIFKTYKNPKTFKITGLLNVNKRLSLKNLLLLNFPR